MNRYFWCFALLHTLAWSLVPTLTRYCYRDDVLEQFSLAREWTWASSKHPNFPAWVLQTANWATDYAYGVPYFLAQAFVLAALWALWRFGRQIVSESAALFGSLVFCLFVYCNGRAIEYNHTNVLVSVWCVSLCMFYGALRWNKLRYWIATGVALGIGLNTFFMVFNLCFAILVFMLWNSEARGRWRGIGPYLTLAIAVVFFLPQLFQMFDSNNITGAAYVSQRMRFGGPWSRLTSPLYFFGGQVLTVLPLLLVLLPIVGFRPKRRTLASDEWLTSRFLIFFTFFPFVCILLYGVIAGGVLPVRYGAELWSLVALLVLFHFERNETSPSLFRSAGLTILIDAAILGFILSEALVVPFFAKPSFAVGFPMHELGRQTQAVWDRFQIESGTASLGADASVQSTARPPCQFVGGEYLLAAAAGVGMSDHPLVQANLKDNANFKKVTDFTLHSDAELNRSGGVILWTLDGRGSYPNGVPSKLFERYPNAKVQSPLRLTFQAGSRSYPFDIGIAVVPIPSERIAF